MEALLLLRKGGSTLWKTNRVVSEEIGKDAISGYLIYQQNCNTFAGALQNKTFF
jgi:hypothetical protein